MVARSRLKNLCRFLAKLPTFESICVYTKDVNGPILKIDEKFYRTGSLGSKRTSFDKIFHF
jgi:hypothetical protein